MYAVKGVVTFKALSEMTSSNFKTTISDKKDFSFQVQTVLLSLSEYRKVLWNVGKAAYKYTVTNDKAR